MALAISLADSGAALFVRRTASRAADAAARHVRLTAVLSVFLIFACFASATVLQMRRDYAHALALAESYTGAQSEVLAAETARELDRLALLGQAYINAIDGQSAARVIETSESDRVLNIALADADGHFIQAMKGQPLAAARMNPAVLARASVARSVEPYSDPAIGSSPFTLVFRADNETPARFVIMPLDPGSLLPRHALGETALFAAAGHALSLGPGWQKPPPAFLLGDMTNAGAIRYVEYDGITRMLAFSPVPGWPLAAATSVETAEALGTWYGSLPLYLFVILGPAMAGAALAVLLVREFERADRARDALVAVTAMKDIRAEAPEPAPAVAVPPPAPINAELLGRLADSERRADEAMRAKNEFLAHMSHELRTPLNAVIGFAEIIQQGMFGPPGQKNGEYAADIAAAGRKLHDRVSEILEFSRLEAEEQPLDAAPLDLARVAGEAVVRMAGRAMGRGIRIAADSEAVAAMVHADEAGIRRVLAILLSNALKYTPQGGAIRVEVKRDQDTIVLGVRDQGAGFTGDEAARAGEAFLRFPRASAQETGLGLGLASAMTLARRMGGVLRLKGAAGEGTWAELRLPAA